ncbi:MAG TPA: methyltransferase [Gemmataceae bacterium]|jgi:SAM-dependent methyltransferase|nr:methyltransferase [Gemmataceae bacterium]
MSIESFPAMNPLPETPTAALGPLVREQVIVEGHSFVIARPGESERLLEHPAVCSAFAADEYLPYWADLWPAARMLAKAILREPWPAGLEALEVGCGLGLPGIAALSTGLRVTFSDYDATALRFAADNARANGFHEFRLLQMDWRSPPEDLRAPVVLASDLLYELRNVEPLVALIKRILAPGGLCLLTDQDRVPSYALRDTLAAAGLVFTTQGLKAGEPGGRRVRGTLYRISHAP